MVEKMVGSEVGFYFGSEIGIPLQILVWMKLRNKTMNDTGWIREGNNVGILGPEKESGEAFEEKGVVRIIGTLK